MTHEREDVSAKDVEPVAIRTGEAADLLREAAARLGQKMDRQAVRRLIAAGELEAGRLTERGWRLVSVRSVERLRAKLNDTADRAANPDRPYAE